MHLDVATANIRSSLGAAPARRSLRAVLALAPDLVCLQEWHLPRHRLLRQPGPVREYLWSVPLVGGCAVGARRDRFALVRWGTRLLSPPGFADRPDRRLGLEPPRIATVALYDDRPSDRGVCLISYHLAPGVQARGRYREDRPVLVGRHRREVRTLEGEVRDQLGRGHLVVAAGDSNFDGLRIDGLGSCWAGRQHEPGTLGPRRKVDDVLGPGRAASVTTLVTESDHVAVIARLEV